MTGIGRSHGAITVVNAMPLGIGATIGIDLETKARFSTGGEYRKVNIINDPGENTDMAEICVRETYREIVEMEPKGWNLDICSQIPVSRGLKSSSSACNAIISAVLEENGKYMEKMDVVRLGVRCAREARVTVTGSFDDACGCHLGGFVVTDNRDDTVILHRNIEEYDVILHVPEHKIRKAGLPLEALIGTAPEMEKVLNVARSDPLKALTMNGEIISRASGLDNSLAKRAMEAGALGAGLSGAGPAIAIVVPEGRGRGFAADLGIADAMITRTRGMKL